MANRKINLMVYAKTDAGWRRYPAAIGGNGKIRPGFGLVNDEPVRFDIFNYQLSQYKGDQRVYTPAGTDAAEAFNYWRREQDKLKAKEKAKIAGLQVVEDANRKELRKEVNAFVQRANDRGTIEAAAIYEKVLDDFIRVAARQGVTFVDEVDERILLRFQGWQRENEAGDRTVFNRHNNVCAFLRWAGVDKKQFGPRPSFEKKLPRAYSRDEVSSLLGAADEYQTVMINVMRQAGLREQEAMFLQWQDIDLKRAMLYVRSKPEAGFEIKDKEQRDVPLPTALVTNLTAWKKRRPKTKWVLGTRNDRPNTKMLLALKGVARRAKLNCRRCLGCKRRQECELFTLHALRRTYATALARSGVDIHAIKDLLGHSDIQTTMAYLGAMKSEEKRKAIDRVKW